MKQVRRNDIKFHVVEPDRHNQNLCKGVIREVRRKWLITMIQSRVPRKFWYCVMQWVCALMQITSTQAWVLGGRTPIESVKGEIANISEYLDFGFYDQVWYHKNAVLGDRLLGCWLGVSHIVGRLMSYWTQTVKCIVIFCMTVQSVTNLERQVDEKEAVFHDSDKEIKRRLGEEDPQQADDDKPNT